MDIEDIELSNLLFDQLNINLEYKELIMQLRWLAWVSWRVHNSMI